MLYAIIIAFIGVNLISISILKNDIDIKDINPLENKNETVIILVSEGESKNYNAYLNVFLDMHFLCYNN